MDDQKLIGLAENPPALPVEIVLQVDEQDLRYIVDTKYRTVDPVIGEVRTAIGHRAASVRKLLDSVFVFPTNQPKACFSARDGFDWSL